MSDRVSVFALSVYEAVKTLVAGPVSVNVLSTNPPIVVVAGVPPLESVMDIPPAARSVNVSWLPGLRFFVGSVIVTVTLVTCPPEATGVGNGSVLLSIDIAAVGFPTVRVAVLVAAGLSVWSKYLNCIWSPSFSKPGVSRLILFISTVVAANTPVLAPVSMKVRTTLLAVVGIPEPLTVMVKFPIMAPLDTSETGIVWLLALLKVTT